MEVLRPRLAEFKFEDVTFFVRTNATLGDKLAIDRFLAESITRRDGDSIPKIGRAVIKQFVVGWDGVTLDGRPVPYSFELIESGFPAEAADRLIPALVKFVRESVDILK